MDQFGLQRTEESIVAIGGVFYLWMMSTRLDPAGYAGLTQRIFGSLFYSWFAAAAYVLARNR